MGEESKKANKPDDLIVVGSSQGLSEVTQQDHLRHELEIVHEERNRLMRKIRAANKRLNEMNKELTDANEKLQVANEFFSITTHELRTPLTAMLGNAQILQRMLLRRSDAEQAEKATQGQNHEQEAALLEKVISEIHQVNKLLTEMVDVTRIRGEVFTLHS